MNNCMMDVFIITFDVDCDSSSVGVQFVRNSGPVVILLHEGPDVPFVLKVF